MVAGRKSDGSPRPWISWKNVFLVLGYASLSVTLISCQAMTPEDAKAILEKHNEYRRQESAANMYLMHWNMTLQERANGWAQRCLFKHERNMDVGENLFFDTDHENGVFLRGLQMWHDEKKLWRYTSDACLTTCHYTQIVTGYSTTVGCSAKVCPSIQVGSHTFQNAMLLVCFYYPRGNFVGHFPFVPGVPCSKCAQGDTCSNRLCVSSSQESKTAPDFIKSLRPLKPFSPHRPIKSLAAFKALLQTYGSSLTQGSVPVTRPHRQHSKYSSHHHRKHHTVEKQVTRIQSNRPFAQPLTQSQDHRDKPFVYSSVPVDYNNGRSEKNEMKLKERQEKARRLREQAIQRIKALKEQEARRLREQKEREAIRLKEIALERKELERQEKERQERERLERERRERERLEKERQENERQEWERLEKERQERKWQEKQRQDRERQDRERQDRERQDIERTEKEHQEKERQKSERIDREHREEKERLANLNKPKITNTSPSVQIHPTIQSGLDSPSRIQHFNPPVTQILNNLHHHHSHHHHHHHKDTDKKGAGTLSPSLHKTTTTKTTNESINPLTSSENIHLASSSSNSDLLKQTSTSSSNSDLLKQTSTSSSNSNLLKQTSTSSSVSRNITQTSSYHTLPSYTKHNSNSISNIYLYSRQSNRLPASGYRQRNPGSGFVATIVKIRPRVTDREINRHNTVIVETSKSNIDNNTSKPRRSKHRNNTKTDSNETARYIAPRKYRNKKLRVKMSKLARKRAKRRRRRIHRRIMARLMKERHPHKDKFSLDSTGRRCVDRLPRCVMWVAKCSKSAVVILSCPLSCGKCGQHVDINLLLRNTSKHDSTLFHSKRHKNNVSSIKSRHKKKKNITVDNQSQSLEVGRPQALVLRQEKKRVPGKKSSRVFRKGRFRERKGRKRKSRGKNKGWRKKYRLNSTALCRDDPSYIKTCRFWAKRGFCEDNKILNSVFCRWSCGEC